MRAVLLNDTRSEPHAGCHRVVNNLLAACKRVGIDIIGTHPNNCLDDAPYVASILDEIDLLLINGEGTMHHDCPKAIELGRAAQAARARHKTVALLNTVWQANSRLNQYLKSMDLVFCRESRSTEQVRCAGHSAETVPDLLFATDTDAMNTCDAKGLRQVAVIDSVDRRLAVQLAWYALRHRHAFLTMHEASWKRIRRRPWLAAALRLQSGQRIRPGTTQFEQHLSRYRFVLSGRFHGICMAMLLGIPVLGVASNTHKMEGLMQDVGIGSAGLVSTNTLNPELLQFQWSAVSERRAAVRHYVQSARKAIRSMLEKIVDATATRSAA